VADGLRGEPVARGLDTLDSTDTERGKLPLLLRPLLAPGAAPAAAGGRRRTYPLGTGNLDLMRFGNSMRRRRLAIGLADFEVAVAAGCSPGTVRRYERGLAKHLPPPLLARLAAALQLDVRALLDAAYAAPSDDAAEVRA
jgi:hypothetical protein